MREPTLEECVRALVATEEWAASLRYNLHLERIMRLNDDKAEAEHEATLKLVRRIRAEVGDQ